MITPRDLHHLIETLERIDGRGYGSYRDLEGPWTVHGFGIDVQHVQADPFAAPSRLRMLVGPELSGLAPDTVSDAAGRTAVACLMARAFAARASAASGARASHHRNSEGRGSKHRGSGRGGSKHQGSGRHESGRGHSGRRESGRGHSGRRGSGRSGEIAMEDPGQVVAPQTAVRVREDGSVEARCTVGLPGRGRRVASEAAAELLTEILPGIVRSTLVAGALGEDEVERHVRTAREADVLRHALERRGLVAFVADGAHLPRRSGIDDRPLAAGRTVPFASPPSLRVEIELPSGGSVTGMGIPPGVTLVVGGGFHGKSTLLHAVQEGVYDHPPGDGRERVVTLRDATKVRAEDGRAVAGVDISSFIGRLPLDVDTTSFSTENASGSTSQASAIAEAIEAGARTLLVDEDTSATNFMIRDRRMQALVPREGEPITPFVDRVRELYRTDGISTILVLGGSGDYLDVADRVVRMTGYRAEDVTDRARAIAAEFPTGRRSDPDGPWRPPRPRRVDLDTVDPARGRKGVHVKAPDARTLLFGPETIDLSGVEQARSRARIRAIGHALAWAARNLGGGPVPVPELLDAVEDVLRDEGLDAFTPWPRGDLANFRRQDLAAALNRLRGVRVE